MKQECQHHEAHIIGDYDDEGRLSGHYICSLCKAEIPTSC